MLDSIKNVWLTLHAVNLFPEVAGAALAAYFIFRHMMGWDARKAVWIPVGISFISQAAFAWPKDAQGIFMCVTMGIFQAGVAMGLYSMADKYGWIDKVGRLVGKKIDEKGGKDETLGTGA